MSDGIRDELRELLFDTAPPPTVDTDAMFARTFAADGADGADLLPPDGLFDLPADDPADELPLDDAALDAGYDPGEDLLDGTADGAGDDDAGDDLAADDLGVDDGHWASGEDPDTGDAGTPDAPFDDHGTGASW
jgi:hypothetical protein